MSEFKSISLQKFSNNIKEKGYTSAKFYTQGTEVKFIQLYSKLQRKAFLLQVADKFVIYNTDCEYILNPTESDYRSFRQQQYLTKIKLSKVACLSKYNLCVKDDTTFSCYLIDTLDEDIDELEDTEEFSSESSSESDIEIDDFSVEDIYPVFDIKSFIKDIDNFEELVLNNYSAITEAEEEMNELEVEKLLQTFDFQKRKLKDRIFSIHKDAYNTHRDISKYGEALQRTYLLKERSTEERDRLRFKIERLANETEEQIDSLNEKLREQRNQADMILQKYWKIIERFDSI